MATFLISAIWFVTIYVIQNFRRKMAITNKGTSFFCGQLCLHSRCSSLPATHPAPCNRVYPTGSFLQNFKNKKKKTKEAITEVTIIGNASPIYVFNYCTKFQSVEKRDGSLVKITNAKMGKNSVWKTYIYLFICTYIYFTYDTDEIADFEI